MLYNLWQKAFENNDKAIQQGLGLNQNQLSKFRKDLFIIFEAGYVCHAPGVLP